MSWFLYPLCERSLRKRSTCLDRHVDTSSHSYIVHKYLLSVLLMNSKQPEFHFLQWLFLSSPSRDEQEKSITWSFCLLRTMCFHLSDLSPIVSHGPAGLVYWVAPKSAWTLTCFCASAFVWFQKTPPLSSITRYLHSRPRSNPASPWVFPWIAYWSQFSLLVF